ncbi:MAG: redox-sensing transcriptional repressor Rex [Pirellula sp.]
MTFSEAAISRLPLYLRELLHIQRHGEQRVQSGVLAKRLGLNASQVRRDLSGFGSMGQRGVGYEVRGLIQTIQQVLGSDRSWNVILVGVGNLGRALSGYRGFAQQGFRLVGAFDIDPSKIGEKLGSLTVMPFSDLEEFVRAKGVELAMIAVPVGVVSEVTERLEMAGVTGILNFAPVLIRRSASPVTVVNVDLAIELQRLAFLVLQSRDESEN